MTLSSAKSLTTQMLTVGNSGGSGSLTMNGGSLDVSKVVLNDSGSSFTYNSGRLNIRQGDLVIGAGGIGNDVGLVSQVNVGPTVVPVNQVWNPLWDSLPGGASNPQQVTVQPGRTLTLQGGQLETGALVNSGGAIRFQNGYLMVTNGSGIAIGADGIQGVVASPQVVQIGDSSAIQTRATINVESGYTLNLNGGVLEAGAITGSPTARGFQRRHLAAD